MADENNKVTIQFGGYDDTQDQTIMFEGPIEVNKTVDNVNLLYLVDVSQYEPGSSVIVFVRNINDENATKGKIPYRGSFFKYDWDKSGWIQIVVGNHSHSNMEILDQLGTINTDSMAVGEKKVVSIEKIDPDEDNNIKTVDYKVNFETINSLPDVPEDAKGKPLYLSTDQNGGYEWTNSFVPAQTFKLLKFVVTSESHISDKELFINQKILNDNNIYFDPSLNDDILAFDTGSLLNTSYKKDDSGLYIYINENDTNQFQVDETITILIIRNGIAGLLDTIKEQYLTKAEAIELLSNGTINLNSYITKDDLKKYAAQINHTHSQYIRKGDYDIFDYRYADFQHTHTEYTTREQVLSIIADAAGESGEIDTDKIIETIVTSLEKKIQELNQNYYDKSQVDSLIEAAKKEVSNSDAIEVTFDGRNLTDYLRYLDNKQNEILHVDADTVELEDDRVNLGEGETLGGLSNGEEIKKGTTLTQLIHRLITKEKPPVLLKPEISFDYVLSNNDAGSNASLKITPKFIQNDAGNLSELTLKIYSSDSDENVYLERSLYNNQEETISNLLMNAYSSDGKCYRVKIIAKYNSGEAVLSNIGISYQINSGEISKEIILYNTRKMYLGTLTRVIDSDDDLTSDDLFDIVNSSNTIYKYDINENNYTKDCDIIFTPETLGQTILFALPESSGITLNKIYFVNQNFDMLDDFSTMVKVIPDVQDQTENKINNSYRIYYFALTQPIISDLVFKLQFRKAGM